MGERVWWRRKDRWGHKEKGLGIYDGIHGVNTTYSHRYTMRIDPNPFTVCSSDTCLTSGGPVEG